MVCLGGGGWGGFPVSSGLSVTSSDWTGTETEMGRTVDHWRINISETVSSKISSLSCETDRVSSSSLSLLSISAVINSHKSFAAEKWDFRIKPSVHLKDIAD